MLVLFIIVAVFLLIPFVLGRLCPMKNDTFVRRPTQPPPIVFSVVWTILYLLYGLAFGLVQMAPRDMYTNLFSVILGATYITTLVYIYVAGCNKDQQGSLAVIVVTLLLSTMLVFSAFVLHPMLCMMLIPQWVWLMYATMMAHQAVLDSETVN